MENFIMKGDRVITSKGRFGRIYDTNGTVSKVIIGTNTFEILNSELLKVDNAKSIEVSYGINYADRLNPLKDIIYIHNKITIFDVANPIENKIFDTVYKMLKTKLKDKLNKDDKLIIIKLNLI